MDKRVAELRERLWKKKAALQQKANLPVSQVEVQKLYCSLRAVFIRPHQLHIYWN